MTLGTQSARKNKPNICLSLNKDEVKYLKYCRGYIIDRVEFIAIADKINFIAINIGKTLIAVLIMEGVKISK